MPCNPTYRALESPAACSRIPPSSRGESQEDATRRDADVKLSVLYEFGHGLEAHLVRALRMMTRRVREPTCFPPLAVWDRPG